MCKENTNRVLLSLPKPDFKPGDPPIFFLFVRNNSSAPFLLAPSSISATTSGRTIRLYTYEELKQGVDKQASRQSFWTRVAAVGDSMSASSPAESRTTGSFKVRDTYGNQAYGDYSSTTKTQDPAANAAARAAIDNRTSKSLSEIELSKAMQLDGLKWVLRENTLEPGACAAGAIKLHVEDMKDARDVLITVQAGDEKFEFPLDVSK